MTFFDFIRQKVNELPSEMFSKLCVVYVQKQDEEDCSSSLMKTIDENKIDIGFDVYTQLTKEYIRTSRTTQDTKKRALEEREKEVQREEGCVKEKRRKLQKDKKCLDEEMAYAARLSQQVETKPTTAVGSVVFQNNSQTFVLKAYKVGDVYFYSETVNGVEKLFFKVKEHLRNHLVNKQKLIGDKEWSIRFKSVKAKIAKNAVWTFDKTSKWGPCIGTSGRRKKGVNEPLAEFSKKHNLPNGKTELIYQDAAAIVAVEMGSKQLAKKIRNYKIM